MASEMPLDTHICFVRINVQGSTQRSVGRSHAYLANGVRLEPTGIHDLGQRRLVERQAVGSIRDPEVDTSMDGLSACHQRRAGRTAARLHVVLRQCDAAIVHLVKVRRRDLAAVRVSTPTNKPAHLLTR